MESLNTLLSWLQTGLTFMLVITVLVAVHELGHFWFAKLCGMKVEAFAVMAGGIRKTNLEQHLKTPLTPVWAVWTNYLIAAGLVTAGLQIKNELIYGLGLVSLSLILPLWLALRIGALYQYSPFRSARFVMMGWLVMCLLFFFGGSAAMNSLQGSLTALAIAGHVGCVILYYSPLSRRPDQLEHEEQMGHGSIQLPTGHAVPVRFRPPLSWTNKNGTEFSLLAWPIGGFVKIRGTSPREDASETQIEGGFYSKSPFARLLVLFAGPAFSILLGIGLLFVVFVTSGISRVVDEPLIKSISKNGAAYTAGLREGDKVLRVNGEAVATFYDIVTRVRGESGNAVLFEVERAGLPMKFNVTPKLSERPTPVFAPKLEMTGEMKRQGLIGVSPPVSLVKLSTSEAVQEAWAAPGNFLRAFRGAFSTVESAQANVGGPGTLVSETHNAKSSGWQSVLALAATLSITLGFMNLLPIPPLDGGQMLIAFLELLQRGKRLSIKVQNSLSMVGVMLVMLLMIFSMSQDVTRLIK